jgi:hypothetical protein
MPISFAWTRIAAPTAVHCAAFTWNQGTAVGSVSKKEISCAATLKAQWPFRRNLINRHRQPNSV